MILRHFAAPRKNIRAWVERVLILNGVLHRQPSKVRMQAAKGTHVLRSIFGKQVGY
jgi:hypothetical protein